MVRETTAELRARLDALEAENDALRARADAAAAEADDARADARAARAEIDDARATLPLDVRDSAPKRHRGRAVLAGALIALGVLLAPVAVVAGWARAELVDTDRFVSTFAPIAEDPAVRAFVAAEVSTAITEAVDIDALTAEVFDGIRTLDLPAPATRALGLLEQPAATGLRTLVDSSVRAIVESDAYRVAVNEALRISHAQIVSALQGDPRSTVAIGNDGTVSLNLGPVIAEVKTRLVDTGVGFASVIPEIELVVPVLQSDGLGSARTIYALAVAVGTWLPWVALAFLALGVAVAPRRSRALLGASIALAAISALLAVVFSIARVLFLGSVSPSIIPTDAASVIYDGLVQRMIDTTVAVAVLGACVAIVTWFASTAALPTRLRAFIGDGLGSVRVAAERRGITTGRFGVLLHQNRVLARTLVGIVAAVVLMFGRPLTPALIIWTVVLALVVVLVLELVQRPDGARVAPVDDPVPQAG
ncbi:hypothetical protein [Agromyces atrinae]|uniref:Uncharacterized protein n=1 Tax=Agromyces atrinae TaxID=592376 RepID=A0A4V1R2K3_9MICO|nr:hypothetical protein [Agromyces atrinae]NYD66802.1 hypothetical protein [Agromyces atrinae]RXZ87456.1 hypothetical protein ESP50_05945 [Agromyces atrinae]